MNSRIVEQPEDPKPQSKIFHIKHPSVTLFSELFSSFFPPFSSQMPVAGTLPRTPTAVLVTTGGSLHSSMIEAVPIEEGKDIRDKE